MSSLHSENKNLPFTRLVLPKRKISEVNSVGYKVYKDRDNFVVVAATLASEAIEKSGIINPYKVVRLGTDVKTIIDNSALITPAPAASPEQKPQ